jgi:hypothetical protein
MITIDQRIKCKKVTGKMFRLVYDDKQIIAIIDGTDESKTWTKHNVGEFNVRSQALAQIDELGLRYISQDNLWKTEK